MRRSGLDESRYPLRESGGRMFYVSGPANYVDQVLHLTQLMDRQRAALRVGQQAFGVVQVLNTHVADREYVMGEEKVNVPGMASLIETVLSREQQAPAQRPPGLLADKSLAVIPYPDTNSLLIKGKPAQVRFIEQLVAELDVPKRTIEVSLWLVDVDRDELKKIDQAWAEETHINFGDPGAGAVGGQSPDGADRRAGATTARAGGDAAGDSHPGERSCGVPG